MAKQTTITLTEPVTFGKETCTELTVVRKLKYLRGHALRVTSDGKGCGGIDMDFATLIDLGAKMVGQPPALLEELSEDDQERVIQEARDFLFKHLGGGPQG
ncbi:hypothetical protein PS3A_03160 [Pseudomonas sp. 3A(2025)]